MRASALARSLARDTSRHLNLWSWKYMAREWDTIIIGGGIVGLATAYALTRAGQKRVLVLERHIVGTGTTSRGTGAVQVHRFSRTDMELVIRSRALMNEIANVVGPAFRFYEVGRFSLAGEADVKDLEGSLELARDCGVDVFSVDPEQAASYVPGIDLSGVALATYSPTDGRIYSNALATAVAGVARDAGTVVWEGVNAKGIVVDDLRQVCGVRVGFGETTVLTSKRVVVAAGAWSRNVLVASGLSFPTRKRIARTATVLIEHSAGCAQIPTFLDAIHELTYIPRNPHLMQIGGHRPGVIVDPMLDLTQNNEVLDDEKLLAGFNEMLAALRQRLSGWTFGPILGGWSGLIDVSPDGQPLMGPYPSVSGLWVNDTAGYGLMRALGAGEAVAAAVLGAEQRVDITRWSLDRLASLDQPAGGSSQISSPFKGIATVAPEFDSAAR